MRDGIAAYLAELVKDGRPAPEATAAVDHIEI
jgi:hypothetical protein